MRKIIATLLLLLNSIWVFACPVCERNQPKILRGITHGAGPESQWDYVIVWSIVAIVLVTLFFSLKWIFRPGETSNNHIKRFILNNE
jgi:hypothetical protein